MIPRGIPPRHSQSSCIWWGGGRGGEGRVPQLGLQPRGNGGYSTQSGLLSEMEGRVPQSGLQLGGGGEEGVPLDLSRGTSLTSCSDIYVSWKFSLRRQEPLGPNLESWIFCQQESPAVWKHKTRTNHSVSWLWGGGTPVLTRVLPGKDTGP